MTAPKHKTVITAMKIQYAWNTPLISRAGSSTSQKRKESF